MVTHKIATTQNLIADFCDANDVLATTIDNLETSLDKFEAFLDRTPEEYVDSLLRRIK